MSIGKENFAPQPLSQEKKPDLFPEITTSFSALYHTNEQCLNALRDQEKPLNNQINRAFIPILEYIAKDQGTLDKKFLFYNETPSYTDVNKRPIYYGERRYLHWNKNKEIGMYSISHHESLFEKKRPRKRKFCQIF